MGNICISDKSENKDSEIIFLQSLNVALTNEIESLKLIIDFRDKRIQLLENQVYLHDKYY
jgi:hypothetical protein